MQKILPNQSEEFIFSELSRGSPNSATRMLGHAIVDPRNFYAIHELLDRGIFEGYGTKLSHIKL
jgi:hypothetical protein